MRKPTVLAVHGPCLDAGVEIALSCDFRFCTPPAVFAVPPGSGATKRLTRLVGPAWAKWMAMAGRQVDGTDARRIGLVHDVFPVETFLDEVYAFCRNLGGFPAKPSAGPNQRTRLPLTRNVQISISGGGPAWTASRAARSPRMDTGMSSGPFEQRSADKPVDVSTARGRAPLPPGRRDAGPPGLAGLLGRYGATTETKL
jgi:enoyl-CoA hydratase/carnithine racemase